MTTIVERQRYLEHAIKAVQDWVTACVETREYTAARDGTDALIIIAAHSQESLTDPLTYGMTAEEKALVNDRKVIQAVKSIRARTGKGLKDAMDVVNTYRDEAPDCTYRRVEGTRW